MIEKLLTAIADWPVILQGALGSALFAGVVFCGQRAWSLLAQGVAATSKRRRRDYVYTLYLKHGFRVVDGASAKSAILTALIYLTARHMVRGAVWLALGLLFGSLLPVLGVVGFLGCLYYWFAALSVVSPAPKVADKAARFQELKAEWERIKDPDEDGEDAA